MPDRPERRPHRLIFPAVVLVVYSALPFLLQDSALYLLSYSAVLAIAAIGIVILTGQAGQVSMAQPFFMGIGAYAVVYTTTEMGLPFIAGAVVSVAAAALAGALAGWLAVRLGGVELAVVSLGIVIIGDYLFHEFNGITGGGDGISSAGVQVSLWSLNFEELGSLTPEQSLFWALWAVVAAVAAVTAALMRRAPGRTWTAIRENHRAAEAVGIDVRREKIAVFALASGLGGLSGALFAGLQQFVAPADFAFNLMIFLLAVVIVGGITSITGAILGALIVPGIQFMVSEGGDSVALGWLIKTSTMDDGFFTPGSFNTLTFGLVIVLVLLAEPRGVMGALRQIPLNRRSALHERTEPAPAGRRRNA